MKQEYLTIGIVRIQVAIFSSSCGILNAKDTSYFYLKQYHIPKQRNMFGLLNKFLYSDENLFLFHFSTGKPFLLQM